MNQPKKLHLRHEAASACNQNWIPARHGLRYLFAASYDTVTCESCKRSPIYKEKRALKRWKPTCYTKEGELDNV